jgi:predicted metalloprotease
MLFRLVAAIAPDDDHRSEVGELGQRWGGEIRGIQRSSSGMALAVLGAVSACVVLMLAGCVSTVDGRAVSMLYDPSRVGGLPVTGGPSGPHDNVPALTGTVRNSDGGEIDRLALLSINDIEDYWKQNYDGLKGSFRPVDTLVSYDSKNPSGSTICGVGSYQFVNAFYCYGQSILAWDRGVLLPAGKRHFGDMSITGVLAHEYAHAVQDMAHLVGRSTPRLVAEQQADCLTGAYLRWVAEGNSSRFTLNTTAGLNGILARLIALRDPVPGPHGEPMVDAGHGTALDRVSAFQMGFDTGISTCLGIDTNDIENRRTGTPMLLQIGAYRQGAHRRSQDRQGRAGDTDGGAQHEFPARAAAHAVVPGSALPRRRGQPPGLVLPGHQHDQRRSARAAAHGERPRRNGEQAHAARRQHRLFGGRVALHAGATA